MIIAIDGQHGTGKSTIINNLQKHYADNKNIVFIKYPTCTDIGNFASSKVGVENNDVLSLLFAADLTNCYQKNISFDTRKIYILDRYILSLFALQGGQNRENYHFLYDITKKIQYPDIQIVICKSDNACIVKNDPFVIAARCMESENLLTELYVVENVLGTSEHLNFDGFNVVREIIDNVIEKLNDK